MSTLDTLSRIARREAENIERQLAAVEGRLWMVRERIRAHDSAMFGEQELARTTTEGALAFGAFAQLALSQRRMIVAEEEALAGEVNMLRDTLRDAFIELKKIEILIDQQAQRAAQEETRQEQIAMDEIATNLTRKRA